MINRPITVLLVIGTLALSACSNTPKAIPLVDTSIIQNVKESLPQMNEARFGEPIAIETKHQIIDLSEGQKAHFLRYYRNDDRRSIPGHQRLAQYIEDIGLVFEYASHTNNAEMTLRTTSGNCMSLAVLTSALARAANIQLKYQLVDRVPIYQEFGNLIFNAQHIRSVIYEPDDEPTDTIFRTTNTSPSTSVFRGRKKLVIDYYPSRYSYASRYVSEDEFLSLYYRNLAAEALGKNEYNKSFWLLKHALSIEPDNAQSINSLAVLHRRVGEEKTAEELYKYGIKHADNKVVLLKNYRILLTSQGRKREANKISVELEGLNDENPFVWLHAANELYDEGDYTGAISLYKKAVWLAPYLHQGYFGIAKSQFARGNVGAARRALNKAKQEALDYDSKSLYGAKLAALSRRAK